MIKKSIERLDKLSLLVGRLVVYPAAIALLLIGIYVPTYGYMHKDDNQLVVSWKAVPSGVTSVEKALKRTDFDMTPDEAEQFMEFIETAESNDIITVRGLRFRRSDVGRARYYERSTFPKELVDGAKHLYSSGKKYACEMVDVR